ncbi:MAG TPA: hypothetical protein VGF00_16870, partial [Acidimicrobiia bacterium]
GNRTAILPIQADTTAAQNAVTALVNWINSLRPVIQVQVQMVGGIGLAGGGIVSGGGGGGSAPSAPAPSGVSPSAGVGGQGTTFVRSGAIIPSYAGGGIVPNVRAFASGGLNLRHFADGGEMTEQEYSASLKNESWVKPQDAAQPPPVATPGDPGGGTGGGGGGGGGGHHGGGGGGFLGGLFGFIGGLLEFAGGMTGGHLGGGEGGFGGFGGGGGGGHGSGTHGLSGMMGFADGGTLTPMAEGLAAVVPPNTWRVIGDHPTADEAYIPLVPSSSRSQGLLEYSANAMGRTLAPMIDGGLMIPFADGGALTEQEYAASLKGQKWTTGQDPAQPGGGTGGGGGGTGGGGGHHGGGLFGWLEDLFKGLGMGGHGGHGGGGFNFGDIHLHSASADPAAMRKMAKKFSDQMRQLERSYQ